MCVCIMCAMSCAAKEDQIQMSIVGMAEDMSKLHQHLL